MKALKTLDWAKNPNVRMAYYVIAGSLPLVIADVTANQVSWVSALLVLSNVLVTAKAFASDPGSFPGRAFWEPRIDIVTSSYESKGKA